MHKLSLSFLATHHGSLTDDFAYHPNTRNMHVKTMVDDGKQDLRCIPIQSPFLARGVEIWKGLNVQIQFRLLNLSL